ncbi:MAG: GatB/YqeY domain-containing protein, partial [Chloroflexi bacterium]
MTTKTDLENALKESIRSGDEIRKRTIRMTLAAVRMVELDKKAPLDEQGIITVLQKEVKSRQESIADAQRANRPDLI